MKHSRENRWLAAPAQQWMNLFVWWCDRPHSCTCSLLYLAVIFGFEFKFVWTTILSLWITRYHWHSRVQKSREWARSRVAEQVDCRSREYCRDIDVRPKNKKMKYHRWSRNCQMLMIGLVKKSNSTTVVVKWLSSCRQKWIISADKHPKLSRCCKASYRTGSTYKGR
jgi:hypothetical protein